MECVTFHFMYLQKAQQFPDEAMGRGQVVKVPPCWGWGGGGAVEGNLPFSPRRCWEVLSKRQPDWFCLPPSFILTRVDFGVQVPSSLSHGIRALLFLPRKLLCHKLRGKNELLKKKVFKKLLLTGVELTIL